MGRLIKASLYKLSKDLTFRVVLIVGLAVAFILVLFNFLFDFVFQNLSTFLGMAELSEEEAESVNTILDVPLHFVNGPAMLVSSSSPTNNYGIAIIINLVIFICLEFTQGTIRNKIIGGNSKLKIYLSLVLTGFILAGILMTFYLVVITLLGSLFGGFNLKELVIINLSNFGFIDANYIVQMLVIILLTYLSVVALTVFITSLFRSVGPAIALSIISLIVLNFIAGIFSSEALPDQLKPVQTAFKILDPFYALEHGTISDPDDYHFLVPLDTFIPAIINNIVFTCGLSALGAFIFTRRDIK